MVVEDKLCTSEVLIPILLVRVDVVAEVSADVAVGILNLAIRLWVVGNTEVEMGTERVKELLLES